MTPRSFFNALEGWMSVYRTDLEVKRLQTLYAVNVWAKQPINDPQQLWKYHWEETKGLNDDKIETLRKRGKELAKKWHPKK
jgi:hypothetical protein